MTDPHLVEGQEQGSGSVRARPADRAGGADAPEPATQSQPKALIPRAGIQISASIIPEILDSRAEVTAKLRALDQQIAALETLFPVQFAAYLQSVRPRADGPLRDAIVNLLGEKGAAMNAKQIRAALEGKGVRVGSKQNLHATLDRAVRSKFLTKSRRGYLPAQGMETRSAETEGLGPKDDSPVLKGCAHD